MLQVSFKNLTLFLFLGHFYGTPRPDDTDDNLTVITHDDLKTFDKLSENLDDTQFPENMAILPPQLDNDGLGPLPPNWEVAYSDFGEKYFIE